MPISKHAHYDFRAYAPVIRLAPTGAAATGNDTTTSYVRCGNLPLEVYYTQNNADIGFTRNVLGWVVPNDQTDNEGAHIVCGQLSNAALPYCFTVGTDPAFFARLTFNIPLTCGDEYDILAFGFITAGACTAAIDDPAELLTAYNDVALFNVDNLDIHTETRGAGGVGVEVDTLDNWTDGASNILDVRVSAAGVASFLINGADPTTNTNTVTFAAGVVLMPAIIYCKDATATHDVQPILTTLTYGYQ